MLVAPMVGFTLMAGLLTVAGLLMMAMAETEQQQACACAFMAILVAFVATLLAFIVI